MIPLTLTPSAGDGTSTVFNVTGLPTGFQSSDLQFYVDRLFQVPTTDYTYVGTSTTTGRITTTWVPPNGGLLNAFASTTVTINVTTNSGVTTGTTTLLTLRTTVRQRADMVNSQFVTDAELTGFVNSSAQELYDLLVEAYGNDYYSAGPKTPYQLTTDGTNEFFALPDGTSTYQLPNSGGQAPAFYKLLGVDVQVNGSPTGWATLHPFQYIERNRYSFPGLQSAYGLRGRLKYRLQGNFLWLRPVAISGQVIRIWYVPRFTQLVNDTDTLDGVNGWEEYVVVDAAIKCLTKEESDCSVLLAQKMELKRRIEELAENRDLGSPAVVGDVRRRSAWGFGAYDDYAEGEW